MSRVLSSVLGLAALAITGSPAGADVPGIDAQCGTHAPSGRTSVVPDVVPYATSPVIYLNRCANAADCAFVGATAHDAMNNRTAIIGTMAGMTYQFPPFVNHAGESGADADDEWAEIVECVRRVYSFYNTEVTDVRPVGRSYHQAVLAGLPADLGFMGGGLLGISDLSCSGPLDNISSFSFAGAVRQLANGNRARFITEACNTVAHEAGHAFGLQHKYVYTDGTPACNDTMSYQVQCYPPRTFFRNRPAKCGGDREMTCACGASAVNSHATLSAVFGDNPAPLVPAPAATVTTPAAGGQLTSSIVASAGSERGVDRVELVINGYKWDEQPGPGLGANGQPNPHTYVFQVPAGLPDSVVDLVARACDDLNRCADSPAVTVTKGAACASADTCLAGQKCEQGKCYWEPPSGEIGDTCTFPQFCLSGMCQGTTDHKICTQPCIPGGFDACPEGLECVEAGTSGVCFLPPDEGGCCSTSRGGMPWAQVGLAAMVLALLRRRR